MEPKPSAQYNTRRQIDPLADRRSVMVVMPVDELQMLYRLRELRNTGQGEALIRLRDWKIDGDLRPIT